jgi:hypothetical protein
LRAKNIPDMRVVPPKVRKEVISQDLVRRRVCGKKEILNICPSFVVRYAGYTINLQGRICC